MRKYIFFYFVCIGLTVCAQTKRPNVIVILADDLGWADLSCYGSSFYETPNLDRLASAGIKFSSAYASSPVCSPTRASLLTGKNPVHTRVTDWIKGRQEGGKAMPYEKLIAKPTAYQLALEEATFAEYALQRGYKTFFAGKWHLGEEEKYWPQYQGFQTNKGGWSKGSPYGKINDSTGGFFPPYNNPMLQDGPKGEYLTDRLTDECLNFLETNKDSNFLLMYSLYAVHNPLQAPRALIKKYEEKKKRLNIHDSDRFAKDQAWMKNESSWKRRLAQDNPVYAAMIENMDTNIGRIIEKIKRLGLDNNTIFIFTSDNGGLSTAEGSPTVNGSLNAGKGWLYEGGIRVPLIVSWKGKIEEGTISNVPVISTDIFPTLASAMDVSYKKERLIEGENIFNLLKRPDETMNRTLYWHYPHYSNQGGKPSSAIRQGNFKLIYNYEDQSSELYNIIEDAGEKNNLIKIEPQKAKHLKNTLMNWLKKTNALYPDPNPGFKQ